MAKAPPHILLVEDEPGTLITTALLLEMAGYRVSKAANGRKGLDQLHLEKPDLLITDYMMPHMDGLQLIAAVRDDERLRDLPVLLMSSALPPDIDASAVADDFIDKPFEYEEFARRVERLLARPPR